MDRILMLVCIISMMSLAQTQRGFYYQHEYQAVYPSNSKESPQSRSIPYTNQPTTDNLSPRNKEAVKRSDKILQESTSLENGTYKILNRLQINKRGGHRNNLLAILLMELQATIGALEDSTGNDNDRVVFPGPTSNSNRNGGSDPDECKNQGYCDNAPHYPNKIAKKIVDEIGDNNDIFQMDILDDDVQIVQRLGTDSPEVPVPLCNMNTTIIYPQSAPDRDGKWHWLLNPNDKKVQGFLAELCLDADDKASCHPIFSVPVNFRARCTQKHVYRIAHAVKKNTLTTYKVQVKLPSCCSCTVTKLNQSSTLKFD